MLFVSGLPAAERCRHRTQGWRRALGCDRQAVLVLRQFVDGTRLILQGSAKSVACCLTRGDGEERPRSSPRAVPAAPCLQGRSEE